MSFQILCCSKVAKFLHLAEEIICDPRSTAFFPSLHRLEPVPGEMCSRKSSHGETWEGGRCATNKQKRATKIFHTRSLGALQAPTSSFRPFEPPWLCPSRPLGAQATWSMQQGGHWIVSLAYFSEDQESFTEKSKKLCQQIPKKSLKNPKDFGCKSKRFCRQIRKISSTNPIDLGDKCKGFHQKI